ncbi:MAG TPA: M14 family metallopeptidase [Ferrovibrio sp.]|uniref:M14 family metallopeptidase n=1 Tax=Ferrovibrio sp. TaxID=1917215 RepID=UPI002ED5FC4F
MHQHFSPDYATARRKFLKAAKAAGAAIESIPHPLKGIAGEDLFTDLAWLGPRDASAVLVTVSGTHGIEGYYGSGCQVGWLSDGHAAQLPAGTAMLLIHASNPYGFSWGRRVNEDNMDINRNFIDFGTSAPPANPAYAEVHGWLVPDDWSGEVAAGIQRRIAAYYDKVGARAATAAIVGGQHSHPDGVFYGGTAPCWSHRTVKAIAETYLRQAARICVLDFHTGLGPFGYSEMICRHAPDSEPLSLARRWFGDAVTSPAMGQSDSPIIEGNLRMGIARFCAPATVVASAIEVGTLSSDEVRLSVIADNWLHLRGDVFSPLGQQIKRQIRAAFYPDSDEWRSLCYPRAVEIQRQALAGLAAG